MSDDEDTVFRDRRSPTLAEDDHSDASEDLTETAVGTPFTTDARARKIRDILVTTYRRFWREFYEMEPNYCLHVMASCRGSDEPSPDSSDIYCLDDDWDAMQVDPVITSDDSDDVVFEELSYWEACTPLSFNIYQFRDAFTLPCRFIKYGGNPMFDERAFLKLFHSSEWQDTFGGPAQEQWRDPDHRRITACTILELLDKPKDEFGGDPIKIYGEDIDDQGILPLKISDILEDMRFNDSDKLGWLGVSLNAKSFFEYQIPWRNPAQSDLARANVAARQRTFCAEPPCIQSVCFQFPYHKGWSDEYPAETFRSNDSLKKSYVEKKKKKPCGPQCFLSRDIEPGESMEHDDLTLLDTALAISPDKPCDISAVVGIPCYKVMARRAEVVRVSKKPPSRQSFKFPNIWFEDEANLKPRKSSTDVEPSPCRHHGPCSARSKCVCFMRGYHCRKNCMCGSTCALRYQGCSAYTGGKPCPCSRKDKRSWKEFCECSQNGWECSEVCHESKDKRLSGRTILCKNMTTQEKYPSEVVVKGSKWGFGAFAPAAIRKGQYIGDYFGEIFSAHENAAHEMLQKFSHYNYTFRLEDNLYYADALTMGNDTRYFNHAARSNVAASLATINGESKNVFHAELDIKRGQEMVFNYGVEYWKGVPP